MDADDVLALLIGVTLLALITAIAYRSRTNHAASASLLVGVAFVLLVSFFLITEEAT